MNQTAGASNNVRCPPGGKSHKVRDPRLRGWRGTWRAGGGCCWRARGRARVCGFRAADPSSAGEGVLESSRWTRRGADWEDGRCLVDPGSTPGSAGAPAQGCPGLGRPARWQKPPFSGITGFSGSGRGRRGAGRQGLRSPGSELPLQGLARAHALVAVRDTCLINLNGPVRAWDDFQEMTDVRRKEGGPGPRSLQNLSSSPEPEGHASGSTPFCAQRSGSPQRSGSRRGQVPRRSGSPQRSGSRRGQVPRAALPGHGQWCSSPPCMPDLASGCVGLQGNSLPGFRREAVQASVYQMCFKSILEYC